MNPMSLQTATPINATGRTTMLPQASTTGDFAALLPKMTAAADDTAASATAIPTATDALPVRATVVDIAGIAATATRASGQVDVTDIVTQDGASEVTESADATSAAKVAEQAVPTAILDKPALAIALAKTDDMTDATDAPNTSAASSTPAATDTTDANSKTDGQAATASGTISSPTVTITPVIVAVPQVAVTNQATAAEPTAPAAPVDAGAAALLAAAGQAKKAGDSLTQAKAALPVAMTSGQTKAIEAKADPAVLDTAAQSRPVLSFADLRDKLRIGQSDMGTSPLPTHGTLVQSTSPLSATQLAQTKIDGTLDLAQSSQWLDQLAKDIASTVDKKGDLRFRLMPAQLGEMTVQMRIGDNGMALKMETRTEDASRIIAAHQSHLSDELRRQGIHVASTDISHNGHSTGQRDHEQRARNPDYPFWTIETGHANDETDTANPTPARRGRFA